MIKPPDSDHLISVIGIGIATGFGFGKAAFQAGVFNAESLFDFLKRPGRAADEDSSPFIGIELPEPPEILSRRVARASSLSGRTAIAVLDEAWRDANLASIDPERIGLIVGGSNLMSREISLAVKKYADKLSYAPPRHAHMFLDTDICGLCCATYPIRGFAYTLGAASASGVAAVIQGVSEIQSARVDACIVLAPLQDVSAHDLQAMRALGAMGSQRFSMLPNEACRPMDRDHDGFVFGEAAAALVLSRADLQPDQRPYGKIIGTGHVTDGTRGPEPNTAGQVRAAEIALAQAGKAISDIDYVNGHATGTETGDLAELATYRSLGLQQARINATKSILGHGLSAAGAVEIVATLMQMQASKLHPTRNLENPIDDQFAWVGPHAETHDLRCALKFSFGFGGVNTAVVIAAPEYE